MISLHCELRRIEPAPKIGSRADFDLAALAFEQD
jgi:hypothetical protein